ncbi:thioredoxin-like domain-containing protein [Glaciecola sp. KUL10]|nr:thioredoxin-like domain-containing protein [Glaciecola sp. KUL10]
MRPRVIGGLVAIWFIASSTAIIFFGNKGLQEFDPNLRLSMTLMDLDFEEKLVSVLPHSSTAKIYHIIDSSCPCAFVNNIHRSSLNKWAEQHQVDQTQLSLSDYPQLSAFVPSTPAVAVIDNESQLVYFGPYSEGAGCLQSEGLVDTVIKPVFEEGAPSQATIMSEAYGCYCETPVSIAGR